MRTLVEGLTRAVLVNGTSTSEHTITGRTRGSYTVRIVALSTHLPSTVATTTTTGGESMSIVFTAYWYIQACRWGGGVPRCSENPPPPFALVVGLKLISYVMSYFEFQIRRVDGTDTRINL